MAMAEIDPTAREHENRGCNWSVIWDACASTVFDVITEEGNHVGAAKVRHLSGKTWLYTDDDCGFDLVTEEAVCRWHLRLEE